MSIMLSVNEGEPKPVLSRMTSNDDLLLDLLKRKLSAGELDHGVVYLSLSDVSGGSKLEFPQISISVPWDARLAFVDREPLANYSHSCRYLLIKVGDEETLSFEARFPPFRQGDERLWRVVYKASGVPDSVLAHFKGGRLGEESQ